MKQDTVVFDKIHSVIAHAAAAACSEAGMSPMSAEGVDLVELLKNHGARVRAFIFDIPSHSEDGFDPASLVGADVEEICTQLDVEVSGFLAVCGDVTRALSTHKQAAIWALCADDVASDLAGGPTAPAATQARVGALKSLAKEYGRMGLSYHALVCQPPRESATDEQWRTVRGALKVYAMRYKAPLGLEYGRFLVAALNTSQAMNGSVVTMGVGVMEVGG
jgi:hypothetical protein